MKTLKEQDFRQLEDKVIELMEEINNARHCYFKEEWLSDIMYRQIFLEKMKKLKEAIDEAIEESLL